MREGQLGAAFHRLEVNFDASRRVGCSALPRPNHPRGRLDHKHLAFDQTAPSYNGLMMEAEPPADYWLEVIFHQPDRERGTIIQSRPDLFDRMRKKFAEEELDLHFFASRYAPRRLRRPCQNPR